MTVADYLERFVTPILDIIKIPPGLMPGGRTPPPEDILLNPPAVKDALLYAAATKREGYRPNLDRVGVPCLAQASNGTAFDER